MEVPLCRSPCGERGLKSLSSGCWCGRWWRRSPCGERGLKLLYARAARHGKAGRSPCGERGLKFEAVGVLDGVEAVAPRAGSVG